MYFFDKTGERSWAAGPLCMHFVMGQDRASTKYSEEIKASKMRNTPAPAMISIGSTFMYTMKALVTYLGTFGLEYDV